MNTWHQSSESVYSKQNRGCLLSNLVSLVSLARLSLRAPFSCHDMLRYVTIANQNFGSLRCIAIHDKLRLLVILWCLSKSFHSAETHKVCPLKNAQMPCASSLKYCLISSKRDIWIPERCKDLSPPHTRSPRDSPTTGSYWVNAWAEERLHRKASDTVWSVTTGSKKLTTAKPKKRACMNTVKRTSATVCAAPKNPRCPVPTNIIKSKVDCTKR